MTPYLCLWVLLGSTVAATTFRRITYRRDNDDNSPTYSRSNNYNNYKGFGVGEGRNSQYKREYSGYDGDDYIPPVGIQHNDDFSALGDGYAQDYSSNGGTGATSYSQVISEHRPAQRTFPSHRSSIRAEGSSIIEKPVPVPIKVPFRLVPSYDRPLLPLVPIAPVASVLAPVKYPIQFFKPISYLAPEKPTGPIKAEQPEFVLTKVPLVYHATYSETPQGQSSFNHGSNPINHSPTNFNRANLNFNHGASNFNQGPSNFNFAVPNFNHGSSNFNHDSSNFNNFNTGSSSLNFGSPNFNNAAANFNGATPNFNHGNSNFNLESSNFNHDANNFNSNFNNFHQGVSNLSPTISTPGTPAPSFNNFVSPTPLIPTPTPYHHNQKHRH